MILSGPNICLAMDNSERERERESISQTNSCLGRGCPKCLTHVILADMNTLATHGQGNIDAVIDEQRHAVGLSDAMEPTGNLDQRTGVACLVAELDASDATFEGLLDDVGKIPVPQDRGRVVSHKV